MYQDNNNIPIAPMDNNVRYYPWIPLGPFTTADEELAFRQQELQRLTDQLQTREVAQQEEIRELAVNGLHNRVGHLEDEIREYERRLALHLSREDESFSSPQKKVFWAYAKSLRQEIKQLHQAVKAARHAVLCQEGAARKLAEDHRYELYYIRSRKDEVVYRIAEIRFPRVIEEFDEDWDD
jgi:cell division protein FtsB